MLAHHTDLYRSLSITEMPHQLKAMATGFISREENKRDLFSEKDCGAREMFAVAQLPTELRRGARPSDDLTFVGWSPLYRPYTVETNHFSYCVDSHLVRDGKRTSQKLSLDGGMTGEQIYRELET